MALRFGLSPFASTREGALRLARAGLEGGFETIWLGDGLLARPDFPGWSGSLEPFVELSWLAGVLEPPRLGLSAAVLPVRDVVNVAKQAATLDVVTEGAFVLAVAAGFWADELAFRGVPEEERAARFDDGVQAILAVWRGEAYEGRWVQVPAQPRVSPEPFTPGGPPLWLAGGEPTMRRALRLGLPFQPSRMLPDALAPLAKAFVDGGGRELGVRIRIEASKEAPKGEELDWHALVGPAQYLTEQLARYAALGVTDVSVVPGQDDATSLDTVAVLASEVFPALDGF